jgi:hypothetical protein
LEGPSLGDRTACVGDDFSRDSRGPLRAGAADRLAARLATPVAVPFRAREGLPRGGRGFDAVSGILADCSAGVTATLPSGAGSHGLAAGSAGIVGQGPCVGLADATTGSS